jgi:hypothetical protein
MPRETGKVGDERRAFHIMLPSELPLCYPRGHGRTPSAVSPRGAFLINKIVKNADSAGNKAAHNFSHPFCGRRA